MSLEDGEISTQLLLGLKKEQLEIVDGMVALVIDIPTPVKYIEDMAQSNGLKLNGTSSKIVQRVHS